MVLQDGNLTRAAVLVFMGLASFADRERRAWPSKEKLAARAGVSVRTVYGALNALQQQRHIQRYCPDGGRPCYLLHEKPKSGVVRVVMQREDEVTSMWRAAMRGELAPPVPEKFVVGIVEQ